MKLKMKLRSKKFLRNSGQFLDGPFESVICCLSHSQIFANIKNLFFNSHKAIISWRNDRIKYLN